MAFFYKHKPRGFNYIPRYYDPLKEEREKRKAEAGYDSQLSHEEQFRHQMRSRWHTDKYQDDPAERRSRMIRIFVIGGFAVLAFYYIFCTPVFTRLVEGLLNK